jgi:hypothetical protein
MIVVNFSTGVYKRGQQRLAASVYNKGYKGLMLDNYEEIGSPTHQQSPYEFKIHAIKKAFEVDDVVLWCDSSMYVKGNLKIIENLIKKDGYFFEEAGHYVDRWCNAHTRKYFNLEEGSGYTMFSAGLTGLNLKSELAMEFFYKWEQSAKAGCFSGSWEDHRHDMTCASIIASRMGMKYHSGGSHMAYIGPGYNQPGKDIVIYCQGIL